MEEQHKNSSASESDIEGLDSRDVKRKEAAPSLERATAGLETLSLTPTITSVQDLKGSPGIWYRIHVLILDLRSYQENNASHDRLETVIDPSYIGSPYFTDSEVAMVKGLRTGGDKGCSILVGLIDDTLKERLERRMKKRVDSGDFRVCAAHDVAPILERVFGVKEKDLLRDKEFVGLVQKWGLELGEGVVWKGSHKKGFKPKEKRGTYQRYG